MRTNPYAGVPVAELTRAAARLIACEPGAEGDKTRFDVMDLSAELMKRVDTQFRRDDLMQGTIKSWIARMQVRHLGTGPEEASAVPPTDMQDDYSGFSWLSPQGERKVVRDMIDGRGIRVLFVSTGGRTNYEILRATDLKAEVRREESNVASRQRAAAAEQQVNKVQNERDRWFGFTDAMTPMQKGKVVKALEVIVRNGGRAVARRDLVREQVRSGAQVRPHPKYKRLLEMPSGSFLIEKDITATGMDLAEFLILKG